ncbi:MAG TPA: hypothetical protein VM286_05375 [Candidatus Thermoplasmatota archaeon]|nr:hypothetical protein [Candidatus Thermoplasmatota archaeon]
MRRLLALGLLLVFALPAQAASAPVAPVVPVLAEVQAADTDLNLPIQGFNAFVGYYDANVNGRFDGVAPDEPAYLDLDASRSATYADLRLSPFGGLPAGVPVQVGDIDVGRALLTPVNAWFMRAPDGAWVLDMDGSMTLSVADITFPSGVPTKVAAGAAGLGTKVVRVEGSQPGTVSAARRDHGLADPVYIEMDASTSGIGRVTLGDLRITPQPSFTDQRLAGTPDPVVDTAAGEAQGSSGPSAWRALDWLVVGLVVLNLVGLIAITRRLNQLKLPPKNPFK